MMIFVDTCVWSLAFRRSNTNLAIKEVVQLQTLLSQDVPVAVAGIVLQELLSGLREEAQIKRLKTVLAPFPLILATQENHILAAQIANNCRSKGIATSATDCLIAAICIAHNAPLLTADKDFTQMAVYCDLKLYKD
jgi:predicted nucleic acid-binding protein